MQPRIEYLTEKKCVGQRMTMSLSENKTGILWSRFMPRRKEILHSIGIDLYSIQLYPPRYFDHFDPSQHFEKWAAVEVSQLDEVPADMEPFLLPAGLYAVFLHKGTHTNTSTFEFIFTTWLPNSEYAIDDRPHFEVLGARYKNGDPESEEEIWVPIVHKTK